MEATLLLLILVSSFFLGGKSPKAALVAAIATCIWYIMRWRAQKARQAAAPRLSPEDLATLGGDEAHDILLVLQPRGEGLSRRLGRLIIVIMVIVGLNLILGWTGFSAHPVLRDWPGQDTVWTAAYEEALEKWNFEEALKLNRSRQRIPLRKDERAILELEEVAILTDWGDALREAGNEEGGLEALRKAHRLAEKYQQTVQANVLATAIAPTFTPTPTDTPTVTPTSTSTNTPTPTDTPTATPTDTPEPTDTPTPLPSPTPRPTYTPYPTFTPEAETPPLDLTKCTEVQVENELGVSGSFQAWNCDDWGLYGQWQPTAEMNSIGGKLPQAYHSGSIGAFYLCPPVDAGQPYTAKTCD